MINVRINTSDIRDDRRAELVEWIRSTLGQETSDLGPWVLVKRARESYELHLSKRRRGKGGGVVLDQASREPVSEPLIIPLTDQQYRAMPKFGIEAVA